MNNKPEDPTGVIILERGMNRDECKALCTSFQIPLREKLFFKMICETTTRPREQDRAVEPQYRRDHLPYTQKQVQPLDQAPYPGCAHDHEAHTLYRLMAKNLRGYENSGPETLYKEFVQGWGRIYNYKDKIIVCLSKKRATDCLMNAQLLDG
jgi:hypothetical protein